MARYILLALFIMLVFWIVRWARRARPPPSEPARPSIPQDMVACDQCGVHLPRNDALPGPGGGVFCCEDHRRAHEQPPP